MTRTFSQSIREAETGGSLEIELQSEFQNSKGYIKNPYLKKREAVKKRKMRDSPPLPPLPSPCVYVYMHDWGSGLWLCAWARQKSARIHRQTLQNSETL